MAEPEEQGQGELQGEPSEPAALRESKPANWDRWVSCAFLRQLGATQEVTVERVGISLRTLQYWEADPRWRLALDEAHRKWLTDCDNAAKAALLDGLNRREQATARWWANRRVMELRTEPSTPPPAPLIPGSGPAADVNQAGLRADTVALIKRDWFGIEPPKPAPSVDAGAELPEDGEP